MLSGGSNHLGTHVDNLERISKDVAWPRFVKKIAEVVHVGAWGLVVQAWFWFKGLRFRFEGLGLGLGFKSKVKVQGLSFIVQGSWFA